MLDVNDAVGGAIWRGDNCCELLYRDVEDEVTADLARGIDVAWLNGEDVVEAGVVVVDEVG